jgi:DNA-binding transcriptional LysR family regulator
MDSIEDFAAFFALSTHGHMGRAAGALGITQPALSVRLRNIERALGIALFERSASGLKPTDAAIRIASIATRARAAIDELREEATRIRSGESNVVRIGITALSSFSRAPFVISQLQHRFPAVRFELREATTHPLEQMLAHREIDLAFLHPPLTREALSVKTLYRERFVLSMPRNFSSPVKPSAFSEWLSEQRFYWVGPALGPVLFQSVLRWAQSNRVRLIETYQLSSYATVQSFIAAGGGIGVVPASVAALHTHYVKTIELPGESPEIGYAIARRKNELSSLHRALVDISSSSSSAATDAKPRKARSRAADEHA